MLKAREAGAEHFLFAVTAPVAAGLTPWPSTEIRFRDDPVAPAAVAGAGGARPDHPLPDGLPVAARRAREPRPRSSGRCDVQVVELPGPDAARPQAPARTGRADRPASPPPRRAAEPHARRRLRASPGSGEPRAPMHVRRRRSRRPGAGQADGRRCRRSPPAPSAAPPTQAPLTSRSTSARATGSPSAAPPGRRPDGRAGHLQADAGDPRRAPPPHDRAGRGRAVPVAADGSAQVELIEPTSDPDLNRALLDSLKRWRFFPAMQTGKPVASTVDIRIPVSVK